MSLLHEKPVSQARSSALITIIIPALNEEECIADVVRAIDRELVGRVIVCDNGSQDATAARARAAGAEVVTEPRRGYGSACLRALKEVGAETEIVGFLDADGSDNPAQLVELVNVIRAENLDFVVGSRIARAEDGALTPTQRFGNQLATTLMRWFFGGNFSDLGPMRMIRKSALDTLEMSDVGMGWTVEMQIKALRRGLRSTEIDVDYHPRRAGQSKVSGSLRGSVRAGVKILWLVLRHGVLSRQKTSKEPRKKIA